MKSKTFKRLVKETAEELNLPYKQVHKAITSAYMTFQEKIVNTPVTHITTQEQYDESISRVPMKLIGSMWMTTFKRVSNWNKQRVTSKKYDKDKV